MRKTWLIIATPLVTLGILRLTWCFDKKNIEVIDDCIIPGDCIVDEPTNEDLSNKYLTAFWTEPFWGIEISWWIASFSSPMYETDVTVSVNIRQEWEDYYFSWEELEGEFILKDCIDWWKWDMHYYTVWVAKFREYYYEWCGDDEQWIKMSDEDVPEDFYQYQPDEEDCQPVFYPLDHEIFPHADIMEEKIKNWFCNIESCMQTLDQYQPEWMPWDPQTQITVSCWPVYYWETYITWYIYTSVYPDLWLRITSPKWYDTFYVKSETPIFVRDWNKISHGGEYIEVFEKSENESLEDIIKKQLKNWCTVQNDIDYTQQTKVTIPYYEWIKIYNIVDGDTNPYIPKDCIDGVWDDMWPLVRFFETQDKTRYYKLVFTDWCAPWPCSIFDEVEIF